MKHLKLPIGYQSFQELRQDDCYYVDKTEHIHRLIHSGDYYFLSRPRRFGKSLLLDTLKELFEGNEALFRGLHIHDRWDWTDTHPVVRLSFGAKYHGLEELEADIMDQLEAMEKEFGIAPPASPTTGPIRFQRLLNRLNRLKDKEIVILVDDYDKPILDVLDDPGTGRAYRDYLMSFYSIIKGSSHLVRFTLVTGITMALFSWGSIFSTVHNLYNISLNPKFATICGYTEKDLDAVFGPELSGLDREEIRRWYNGYHWLGEENVYNPHDLLLLFQKRKFAPYWFETGTPDFLCRMMKKREFRSPDLENLSAARQDLTTFDLDKFNMKALLFQTGHLTIREQKTLAAMTFFTLGYPNEAIRYSLSRR